MWSGQISLMYLKLDCFGLVSIKLLWTSSFCYFDFDFDFDFDFLRYSVQFRFGFSNFFFCYRFGFGKNTGNRLIRLFQFSVKSVMDDLIYFLSRFSSMSFFGRRNWLWHGNSSYLQDKGGVSWPYDDDLLCFPFS